MAQKKVQGKTQKKEVQKKEPEILNIVDTTEMLRETSLYLKRLVNFDRYVTPTEGVAAGKICIIVKQSELDKKKDLSKILEFNHFEDEGIYPGFSEESKLFSTTWEDFVVLYKISIPFVELEKELKTCIKTGRKSGATSL